MCGVFALNRSASLLKCCSWSLQKLNTWLMDRIHWLKIVCVKTQALSEDFWQLLHKKNWTDVQNIGATVLQYVTRSFSNTVPTDTEAIQSGGGGHGKHAAAAVRASAIRCPPASQRTAWGHYFCTQAEVWTASTVIRAETWYYKICTPRAGEKLF